MAPRTLHIACAGLGRMGKRHALNILHRSPRSSLVAAFTPDPLEAEWADANLVPYGVTIYSDYDAMLGHSGLEAVLVSTITTVHAEQAIKAIEAGKHVLCEKPLSTDAAICQSVADAATLHPELKVMCGFSRRFDVSYRDAYSKMRAGLIGTPAIIRSQTCDKIDPTGAFVNFAATSGGIFCDCSVHDIDLILWFFGADSKVKSVVASGTVALHPELKAYGDADNAVGIIEFHGGRVAYLYCSRMMAAGQEDTTEIIGTEGKLVVNGHAQKNLVGIFDRTGARRELPAHYYERFEMAFVDEVNEFAAACLDDTELPMGIQGAVEAVRIAKALQDSLGSGEKVRFDELGARL
ncbi:NAD binding Rossmann fold oxidoreductase [Aspergillus costaricaensis CBS 115574]|uniref:NAD binding Rossmann fold oxidoreductase n=1 Tax=Aspergillus costaricaensis CBS 115574 TaxID=1448317 RepID=A0ACD1IJR0_9EURO|nr:NAD binding Rossmann fold oxidoreductase [Aspergillus costaricaensis CBS 115574]RAK90557.1 NAD binding Rossmann fold oxidoreductase [Aspergillus costaricaensis CBS 115574]